MFLDDTLRPEKWDIAMILDVVRGISTALGFFDDSNGSSCALVMLDPLYTDLAGTLTCPFLCQDLECSLFVSN